MTHTPAQIEAAAKVFCDNGIEITCPWEADLDDVERERFNALVAALAAAEKAAWQQIKTAPHDRKERLLTNGDVIEIGWWQGDKWYFNYSPSPTHWCPLPPLPDPASENES
jgi:hypothetical protein